MEVINVEYGLLYSPLDVLVPSAIILGAALVIIFAFIGHHACIAGRTILEKICIALTIFGVLAIAIGIFFGITAPRYNKFTVDVGETGKKYMERYEILSQVSEHVYEVKLKDKYIKK